VLGGRFMFRHFYSQLCTYSRSGPTKHHIVRIGRQTVACTERIFSTFY